MKNLFRAIIKAIFVVILPILVPIVTSYYMIYNPVSGTIVIFLTMLNGLFYYTKMRKVSMLPTFSFHDFAFEPIIGLSIGCKCTPRGLETIIIVPFMVLEVHAKFKKKSQYSLEL
jgi:hypothetical protein